MGNKQEQAMPTGKVIKLMERGQVTIPAKYRRRLNLKPEALLNVFVWRGMVIAVPVELEPKTTEIEGEPADWNKDNPQEYLKKVRYTPLEELWTKMAREK